VSERESFEPGRDACGGFVRGSAYTSRGACTRPPTWVGLIFYEPPPRVWRAYACDEHRDQLDVSRPLEPRDEADLEARRDRARRARAGEPAIQEQPLATGSEARALLRRAQEWTARPLNDGPDGPLR
jgi:hypothetical protein